MNQPFALLLLKAIKKKITPIANKPVCVKCRVLANNHCPICHLPLEGHLKCDSCFILVGPGHHEKSAYHIGGNRICHWCMKKGFTRKSKNKDEKFTG